MGFTEVLTIIFVLLKAFGVITWSWWIVFLPEIIAIAIYILLTVFTLCGATKVNKRVRKHFDEF